MVAPLEARGLGYAHPGGARAVDRVDLALEAGELCFLIGPNGAGKTTLLRLLAGLLAPADGRVELAGRPLGAWSPRERAREIAYVAQGLAVPGGITLREFVASARYARRRAFYAASAGDRRAVTKSLESCGLTALAERGLTELSFGERQRALLARALAQETRCLLLDEPASGLDPAQRLGLVGILRARARDAAKAVLAVTHDLNLAAQFGDRVVLLDAGELRTQGAASEVLRAEVLEPVYGSCFVYGERHAPAVGEARPFVLPWQG